jgi:hypothetical protein
MFDRQQVWREIFRGSDEVDREGTSKIKRAKVDPAHHPAQHALGLPITTVARLWLHLDVSSYVR